MPPDPLTSPIAALTNHPILSAEEEASLIATLRAGVAAQAAIGDVPSPDPALLHQIALGTEARAALVRHNMRLVVSIAKRYLPAAGQAFTLDDLISLGCVGLLRGIDKFDSSKSGKRKKRKAQSAERKTALPALYVVAVQNALRFALCALRLVADRPDGAGRPGDPLAQCSPSRRRRGQ